MRVEEYLKVVTQGEEEGEVVPAHDVHWGHLNQCPKWAWKKKKPIFFHTSIRKKIGRQFFSLFCLFKEQRDEKDIKKQNEKVYFFSFFCQITCLVHWQRHPS